MKKITVAQLPYTYIVYIPDGKISKQIKNYVYYNYVKAGLNVYFVNTKQNIGGLKWKEVIVY